MSETPTYGDVTTQIVREDPQIEAIKLGLLQDAKDLVDTGITLPTQQVADMAGLQTQAIQAASPATGGIGGFESYLQGAGQTLGQVSPQLMGSYGTALTGYQQGAGPVTGEQIQGYMNPYQEAIQAEINRAFDIQQAQAGLSAAGAGAFGGSRAAVQEAEIGRNRASALAQAQAQNFLQAQQAAEREQGRQLQSAQGIGSLGVQTGQALGQLGLQQAGLGELAQKQALMDIQTQFDLGKQQQLQQQAQLEAERQNQLAQLYEPYQRLSFLSDIYRGAPSTQQTIASASSPGVSPAQTFLGLGVGALSAAAGAKEAGLF
tara:strand:- start:8667 stop:9620 length:954 start_codon:yes stop_codon:yes gene_type:complete